MRLVEGVQTTFEEIFETVQRQHADHPEEVESLDRFDYSDDLKTLQKCSARVAPELMKPTEILLDMVCPLGTTVPDERCF